MKKSIFFFFVLAFFIFTGCSNNNTEFLIAIEEGDIITAKSLVEDGADVKTKIISEDGTEQTPLHVAVLKGHASIVRLLINRGADPFAVDSKGNSPIQIAELNKNQEIIDILIQIGYVKQKIIPLMQFRRVLRDRFNWYKRSYRSIKSKDLHQWLVKLKIHDMVLQSLINNIIIQYEADKLYIKVSDKEIKEKIVSLPALQKNGKFVGKEKYKIMLASRGITLAEFENELRMNIITQRLRERITEKISIDEEPLKKEYVESKTKSSITLKEFINRKIEEKKNLVFVEFLTNKKQEYDIHVNGPLFQGISQSIIGKI